ncbi:MAG: hypothetical protein LC721_11680 [Actinobacteria bacterium]|nr:hypothetical protein [Actinomycetota bacterium]
MLAIRQVTPAIGMLSGKGSTRKADEAIMAMRDDMSDEEHLGDKFMAMTVLMDKNDSMMGVLKNKK